MTINRVGVTQTSSTVSQTVVIPKNRTETAATPQESVSLSAEKTDELTYADPRKSAAPDQVDLTGMLEESDRKVQAFIDMLGGLLQQQGLDWAKVASGEQKLSADPETIEAAKQAISEDGEFGVRKTAERILSFARSAMGDDPAKLSVFRAAIEQGFQEASDFFGGHLPEVSQQTHDAITAELDRWEKEGIPSSTTISLAKPDQTIAP